MPKYRVRHALITINEKHKSTGTMDTKIYFRDQVVDIPPGDQLDRLLEFGAIIDPSQDLERPGRIMDLPASATDEELLAWIANATKDEVRKLATDRPDIAPRLAAAYEVLDQRRRAYNDAFDDLGTTVSTLVDQSSSQVIPEFDDMGRPTAADPGLTAGVQQGVGGDAASGAPGAPAPGPEAFPGGNDPQAAQALGGSAPETGQSTGEDTGSGEPANPNPSRDPHEVVKGNVSVVKEYIATHPTEASDILEAEKLLAARKNEDPRPSVVKAVEAAAGFTQ